MKINKVCKIIHYCMLQGDQLLAESFLQSFLASLKHQAPKRIEKRCSTCKNESLATLDEPCFSCSQTYDLWEAKEL